MTDKDGSLPDTIFDRDCRACPRLAGFLDEVNARHPDYYCRPVPPFGDAKARLLIVGLAPGMHGANRTGRPFTGDHAGILLYETLHRFGFSTAAQSLAADDGLQPLDCRITNAVLTPGSFYYVYPDTEGTLIDVEPVDGYSNPILKARITMINQKRLRPANHKRL